MNNQPPVRRELVDVYRSLDGRARETRRERRREVRQRRKELGVIRYSDTSE